MATQSGRYIDSDELDRRFGTANIDEWSDKDGDGVRLDAAVADAIAWAEDHLDGLFASYIYNIPFSPVPVEVKYWAQTFAASWLYESRGLRENARDDEDSIMALRVKAEGEIATHRFQSRNLATTLRAHMPTGPTHA